MFPPRVTFAAVFAFCLLSFFVFITRTSTLNDEIQESKQAFFPGSGPESTPNDAENHFDEMENDEGEDSVDEIESSVNVCWKKDDIDGINVDRSKIVQHSVDWFPDERLKTSKLSSLKAAIVYLSTSEENDLNDLKMSLRLLETNVECARHYPIAIFHEDFTEELMRELQGHVRSLMLEFVRIEFTGFPKYIQHLKDAKPVQVTHKTGSDLTQELTHEHSIRPWSKRSGSYPYGYQHMCRFFAGAGYFLPYFQFLDYYLRLDTDSYLYGTYSVDLFEEMEVKEYTYGYVHMMGDGGETVENLWNTAVKYVEDRGIEPTFMFETKDPVLFGYWGENNIFTKIPIFYNNFELVRLSFLRGKEYQSWFEYIDREGGIYMFRWGDAPIRWLGLSMHVDSNKLWHVNVPSYQHG